MIGLLASILGGRGGSAIGRMLGGRTGAMVGGLAGSLIGGRKLSRLGHSLFDKSTGTPRHRGASVADDILESDFIDNSDASTLIRVMCNAAKADGHVDADEAQKIAGELGDDVSVDERSFLEAEITSPMRSARDMAREVPAQLRNEAYAVSLLTVTVDTVDEANYLKEFASALGLSSDDVREIHSEVGV